MCKNIYCQKCLQKCVEDEVIHDHNRGCWSKFCGLINVMIDWGKDADDTSVQSAKLSDEMPPKCKNCTLEEVRRKREDV